MNKIKYILALSACLLGMTVAVAQEEKAPRKHAWEIGVGGNGISWSRINLVGHAKLEGVENNMQYDFTVRHLLGGGNLYVAYQINPLLYVDLQGTVSATRALQEGKWDMMYMGGLGLQVRFTDWLKSKYVEPYLRFGVNYAYRDFHADPNRVPEGHTFASWDSWNARNAESSQFASPGTAPLSIGAGMNAWMTNSFGLGVQADYYMPIQRDQPRFVGVTARLIWRIGGDDKRQTPYVNVIERPVQVIKDIPNYVERPISGDVVYEVCSLFDDIEFEFDKDVLTARSHDILDEIAVILKQHPREHFLVVGYTDARGSLEYNMDLGSRRARIAYEALIARGVPTQMLKWRSVGETTAIMPEEVSHELREGDRRVALEHVSIQAYWDKLK